MSMQIYFTILIAAAALLQGSLSFVEDDDEPYAATKQYVEINGKQYYISPFEVKFEPGYATYYCNDLGLKLLSLETEEELDAVLQYLLDNGMGRTWFWTSGHYIYDEWIWTGSGQVFSYFRWEEGDPNIEDESDAHVFIRALNGTMNDYPSNSNRSFICEEEK